MLPSGIPLAHGFRPRSQDRDDEPSHGWQHDVSGKVTDDLMNRVWPERCCDLREAPCQALLCHPFRGSVPRSSASFCFAPLASPPSLCALLPVWPSSRRLWPPPRSVCCSWGVVGSPGTHQRRKQVLSGPRHCFSCRHGHQTSRSGGRRVATFPQSPTRRGHHHGESTETGRFSMPSKCTVDGAALASARDKKEATCPESGMRFS